MKAGECGAIDVIVNAMKKHIDNVVVCKWGCSALENITASNGIIHIIKNKIIYVYYFSW